MARVGEQVELECPIEPGDCFKPGKKAAYMWEKFSGHGHNPFLDDSAKHSRITSIDRVLTFVVLGAKDGGHYRCYSFCDREKPSAWIQLNGIYCFSKHGSGATAS